MGFKGAVAPLKTTFPLSFEGEGDKGGEVVYNLKAGDSQLDMI